MEAIFSIFFPVFASGGSGLAEGVEPIAKKGVRRRGVVGLWGGIYSYSRKIQIVFFFGPAAGWLQQSDVNTRVFTHTQIKT